MIGFVFCNNKPCFCYVCVLFASVSEVPSSTTTTNKDELVKYLHLMYTMRRMEITNDTEYKVRFAALLFNPLHTRTASLLVLYFCHISCYVSAVFSMG
jgi:hypothetical protein